VAGKKGQLLKGYEGVWINARRNNYCYYMNKIISMGLSLTMAIITLYLKLMAMKFIKAHNDQAKDSPNKIAVSHMQNIYWLMFIYLSMQSMDELIELMSQAAQMEKGALGLFFEMNHFVGIGLSIYIGYFILGVKTLKFGKSGSA